MMNIKLKDMNDMQRHFFGPDADNGKMYSNIHRCIETGILEDLDEVVVCYVEFTNGDEPLEIACKSEDYLDNLGNVLSWYEDTEQFEKCKEVVVLTNIYKKREE